MNYGIYSNQPYLAIAAMQLLGYKTRGLIQQPLHIISFFLCIAAILDVQRLLGT